MMCGIAMSAQTSEMEFAAVLRRFRLAAGLTQEQLAERARLSVRGVNDLERGARRAPRKETVQLLAEALALSPAERSAFEAAARGYTTPSTPRLYQRPMGSLGPAVPTPGAPVAAAEPATALGGFLGAQPYGPLVGREAELRRALGALAAV